MQGKLDYVLFLTVFLLVAVLVFGAFFYPPLIYYLFHFL